MSRIGPAILRAFDPKNLTPELYDSSQNAARDQLKRAMDALNLAGFGVLNLRPRAEDFEIELRRKPRSRPKYF